MADGGDKKHRKLNRLILPLIGATTIGLLFVSQVYVYAPDAGKLGGPIEGLSARELRKFYECKKDFEHLFRPEEGLGPMFNERSCYACHGQPGTPGGPGQNLSGTSYTLVGSRNELGPRANLPLAQIIDSATGQEINGDPLDNGPELERRAITEEFPDKFPASCRVDLLGPPTHADVTSRRQAPALFGAGLLNSVTDDDLEDLEFAQGDDHGHLAGHVVDIYDTLNRQYESGKFGWKDQYESLYWAVSEELNTGLGITTPSSPVVKSGKNSYSPCFLNLLPAEPNDQGRLAARLTYFLMLLAPPPRGAMTPQVMRGQAVFEKLNCAVCHKQDVRTASRVKVVDPDSPAPRFHRMEVAALSKQTFHPFTDLLVHNMGKELADGLPQHDATGGEWRTPPLWGLRFRKYYLHDGRTTDLKQAILLHGGQGDESRQAFLQLPGNEQEDLLSFLKSL